MYRIKLTCFDVDPSVPAKEEIFDAEFESEEEAYETALVSAVEECERLNHGGNEHGNYFEVNEGGEEYDIAVEWYDHAPDDRENDCDIRTVTGYTIEEDAFAYLEATVKSNLDYDGFKYSATNTDGVVEIKVGDVTVTIKRGK